MGGTFRRCSRLALLCFVSLALRAACGDMLAAVDDDPDGVRDGAAVFAAGSAQPEAGALAGTRHSCLICSMLAMLVKCLLAMSSTISRPRAASRRSPDAVIEPSGKATAAATLRRSGVSGSMLSRFGILQRIVVSRLKKKRCPGPKKYESRLVTEVGRRRAAKPAELTI